MTSQRSETFYHIYKELQGEGREKPEKSLVRFARPDLTSIISWMIRLTFSITDGLSTWRYECLLVNEISEYF